MAVHATPQNKWELNEFISLLWLLKNDMKVQAKALVRKEALSKKRASGRSNSTSVCMSAFTPSDSPCTCKYCNNPVTALIAESCAKKMLVPGVKK